MMRCRLPGQQVQLAGGTSPNPNTIAGGLIDGGGTLTTNGVADLRGSGTIEADVDFSNDSDLHADGGTLAVNGAILGAHFLGTANSTGTLQLGQTLDTGNLTALELKDGIVSGVGIINNGITRGHGLINVSTFLNNGTIFGSGTSGQSLRIGASGGVDLDGAGINGGVEATSGDVTIISPLTDDFGGTATVGSTRTLTFGSGWTLGTNGTLNLNGLGINRATLDSTTTTLRGDVNVTAFGRMKGSTTFHSDADVAIPNVTDRLEVEGTSVVQSGASFVGAGALSNFVAGQMTLENGATIGTPLLNNGQLLLEGIATVLLVDQISTGELVIDLITCSGVRTAS